MLVTIMNRWKQKYNTKSGKEKDNAFKLPKSIMFPETRSQLG